MEIELIKGGRFNLSKEAPNLKNIAISLGWQVERNEHEYDIDASVFMLGSDGKVPDEKYFVFYNNPQSFDGSLNYLENERANEIKKTIQIDFTKVAFDIKEIVFIVTIHQGQEKQQNFSQIKNAFIKLGDRELKNLLACYNLKEAFSQETALEFGRLYRKDSEWRFQAVGEGYK